MNSRTDGLRPALAVLQTLAVDKLAEASLTLRAELAEKAGDTLDAVMCLQAIAAHLFGLERARAIMEWEAMQGTALLRAGAVVALASGVFVAIAFTKRPSEEHRKTAHCNN